MAQISHHQPPRREGATQVTSPPELTEYRDLSRDFQAGFRASDRMEYSGFRLGDLEVTLLIILVGDVH